jgi:hypothetical protein
MTSLFYHFGLLMIQGIARLAGALHRQVFNARLARLARHWHPADERSAPVSQIIRVSAFFSEALGIGSAGDMTAAALEAAGLTVIREDIRPLQRRLMTRRPEPFATPGSAGIWLIHANPPEARILLFGRDEALWRDLYRIGYWTWESSIAPASWLETARWFHEIWVPAPSVRDAFADAFSTSPWPETARKLRVVPHPVPVLDAQSGPAKVITAVTLFDPRSDIDRKNPQGAVEAWVRAFPTPSADRRLIIKTLPYGEEALRRLSPIIRDRNDIRFQCQTLSRPQTENLIASSDILISMHRGEGFGLTVAEAMSAGRVALATGWSGNMAFMTPDNSAPIPYRLVAANARHNGPEASWAEPDVDAAAGMLRTLAEDADLRTRLGRQATADIAALREAWTRKALFGALT